MSTNVWRRRKIGHGWRVAADGSFAFRRGRWGTVQVSGTVRPSRRKRKRENRELQARALAALALLF